MQKNFLDFTATVTQGKHYFFFAVNLASVSDSYRHACFMYSVFDEIKANPDIDNCYLIGLMGDTYIPNKAHFGVFSSILFDTNSSYAENQKIMDFTWNRLAAFLDKYDDEDEEAAYLDQYVIKCVPIIKTNGDYLLKKGVIINEGALKIKKIPTLSTFTLPDWFNWVAVVFLFTVIGFIVGRWT